MTELNPDSVAFSKEGTFNKTPVLLSISQAPGSFSGDLICRRIRSRAGSLSYQLCFNFGSNIFECLRGLRHQLSSLFNEAESCFDRCFRQRLYNRSDNGNDRWSQDQYPDTKQNGSSNFESVIKKRHIFSSFQKNARSILIHVSKA